MPTQTAVYAREYDGSARKGNHEKMTEVYLIPWEGERVRKPDEDVFDDVGVHKKRKPEPITLGGFDRADRTGRSPSVCMKTARCQKDAGHDGRCNNHG